MMTNLFSTFDPATSLYMSMNWYSSMIGLMIIPTTFWLMPNRMNIMFSSITSTLNKEYNMLLNMKNNGMNLMLISLFMYIMWNNMMGLLPYIFTSSSHLSYTLTLALPMWMGIMLYGWINKTQMMFAHMIPNGVPFILMPFMVIIETVSNIIRPGSLSVRLTANMIAGHLFMSMLGNNMPNNNMLIMTVIIMLQMILMMFETAVSIIQAYVFSTLMTLYSSEVNYVKT